MGIAEQTFYTWKLKYAELGLSERRALRQLREENTKLKQLVAARLSIGTRSIMSITTWNRSRSFIAVRLATVCSVNKSLVKLDDLEF